MSLVQVRPEPEAIVPALDPIERIVIVTDAWQPQINGVVRTLVAVAAELQTMGHAVEVIGPDRFRTLPLPTYPDIPLAVLPGRQLARRIAQFAPTMLHIATEGPLGFAARRWAMKRRARFTTSFHTKFPEYIHARTGLPTGLAYAWMRRFHNAGAATMVATDSLHRELDRRGFSRVADWSRGVDLDLFKPAPREPWEDLPRPVFLYVGRVAVEKNIAAFLTLDLPGSKVVVGGGPQLASLQRDYPQVMFAGPRFGPHLAQAYAGADVFVFPSLTDTFGLVVLESLACGTPVAAFPVTGPRDILEGAGRAVGVSVGAIDADLRKAAMAALEADRAACRAYAERFSWRACAETFLSHLVHMHA